MKRVRLWSIAAGWIAAAVLLSAVAWTPFAHAAEAQFPTRPISIIVPYGAGGGPDINARLVAAYWTEETGATSRHREQARCGGCHRLPGNLTQPA